MIVDRIEEGVAVLENGGGSIEVPADWLPGGAREGSVVKVQVQRDRETSRLTVSLDPEGQAAREAAVRRLRDSIPEGPAGDITL